MAKTCEDFGQRVEPSVFEIDVDRTQWVKLKSRLEAAICPERDSLRYYCLGANWIWKTEHMGAKSAMDMNGPLILS